MSPRAAVCLWIVAVLGAHGCASARLDRHTSARALEARIASLSARLDSLETENHSLRADVAWLEMDLLDREEQIGALRLELQRLKEIDLKPRPRSTPP